MGSIREGRGYSVIIEIVTCGLDAVTSLVFDGSATTNRLLLFGAEEHSQWREGPGNYPPVSKGVWEDVCTLTPNSRMTKTTSVKELS